MKRNRQYPIQNKRTSTRRAILAMAAAFGVSAAYSAHAATENWIGATNGNWGINTNWSDSAIPDSTYDLTILGPGNVDGVLNINIAAPANANSINFTDTSAVTLTNTTSGANQTLTLGAGGLTVGSGSVAIGSTTANQNVNIALTASQTWSIGSGGLTATNVISGTGFGITKTGAGTLTLSSSNTFTGGLTISAGTVLSTAAQGFGNGGSTVSTGAAGTATVTLGSDQNVNNIFTGNGTLTVTGNTGTPNFNNASGLNAFTGTLNVNTTGVRKVALTTAGEKIGSGATVNITSGGTLYIATTTASFDGVTFNVVGSGNTENLGAIRIEAGSVIGATSSIVLGGDTSLGSNTGTGTINAAISQSTASAVTKLGNGTLVFGGNNSYTGATILTGGTLSISTDSAGAYNLGGGGTNGITFNGGTLQIVGTAMTSFGSHTLTFNGSNGLNLDINNVANNFTVGQTLSQTGAVVKTGAGTLTLSGANTYTGGTRANAGTLVLSGSHTKAAGTTDFLSINNVGAQNAVLKITAGTQGFTDINDAEATNARGAIYQSGGDLSTGTTGGIGIKVGSGNTSYGYYNLSGGTLTLPQALDFQIGGGSGATGVMDISGGSVTTGSWVVLGRNGAGNGLLNVTGGSFTSNSNNIALNWANTAGSISILNVGGGAGAASVTGVSNAANYFDVSQSNTAGTTGVANLLSNGTLTVAKVQASNAGSTALFNFNGGTLKATAANAGANFMTSGNVDAVTIYNGGGTIDNNGTTITIGNALGAATGNGVTSIAVATKGSGYIGAPLVNITGGTGNAATGYAVMEDDGTGNGTFRVASIVITSPGTYTVDPTTVTLTGGGASTVASIGTITTAANTSGGMTFTGSGMTKLTGASSYSGGTTISNGTVAVASANGTNTNLGTGTVTISAGGTLRLGNGATNTNISTTGNNIALNGGTIYAEDANQHLSGNVSVSGSSGILGSTYNAGNNAAAEKDKGLALDGIVTGSGALTVQHTRFSTGFNYNTSFVSFSNNSNTYSGTITVNENTTTAEGGVYLGVNGSTALQNATLVTSAIPGTNLKFGTSPVVFKTGLGSATIGAISGSGALVLTGYDQVNHVYGADSIALTVGGNNASTTYSGTISGGGSLNKSGSGAFTLSGGNTYTGATTVQAGTLVLSAASNNIASSSKILVGDTVLHNTAGLDVTGVTGGFSLGATQALAGFGTVTGNVTGVSGSSVAPGGGIGKLTINGNLTLGQGKLVTELSKTGTGSLVAGTDYDQLVISTGKAVDVTSGTLALQFGNNLVNGDVYYILDNQGADAVAGTFAGATMNGVTATGSLAEGGTFSALYGGNTYSFSISYGASAASGGTNDIALTAVSVPEPTMSLPLLGLGAWGLMSRRRKSAGPVSH